VSAAPASGYTTCLSGSETVNRTICCCQFQRSISILYQLTVRCHARQFPRKPTQHECMNDDAIDNRKSDSSCNSSCCCCVESDAEKFGPKDAGIGRCALMRLSIISSESQTPVIERRQKSCTVARTLNWSVESRYIVYSLRCDIRLSPVQ